MTKLQEIVTLGYVPLGGGPFRGAIPYREATISFSNDIKHQVFTATCSCGMADWFRDTDYLKGGMMHGGGKPLRHLIGLVISPYHRSMVLRCGACGAQQIYEKPEEYERRTGSVVGRLKGSIGIG